MKTLALLDLFSLAIRFAVTVAILVVAAVAPYHEERDCRVILALTFSICNIAGDLWLRIFLMIMPMLVRWNFWLGNMSEFVLRNYLCIVCINAEEDISSAASRSTYEDLSKSVIYFEPTWFHAIGNGLFAVLWVVMVGILSAFSGHLQDINASGLSIALYIVLACLCAANTLFCVLRTVICTVIFIRSREKPGETPESPSSPQPLALAVVRSGETIQFDLVNGMLSVRPEAGVADSIQDDELDSSVIAKFNALSESISQLAEILFEHSTFMKSFIADDLFARLFDNTQDKCRVYGIDRAVDAKLGEAERLLENKEVRPQVAVEFRRVLIDLGKKHNTLEDAADAYSKKAAAELYSLVWNYLRDINGFPSHVYSRGDQDSVAYLFAEHVEAMFRTAYLLSIAIRSSGQNYKWVQAWDRNKGDSPDEYFNIVERGTEGFGMADVQAPEDIRVLFGAVVREDFEKKQWIVLRPFDLWLAPTNLPQRMLQESDEQASKGVDEEKAA